MPNCLKLKRVLLSTLCTPCLLRTTCHVVGVHDNLVTTDIVYIFSVFISRYFLFTSINSHLIHLLCNLTLGFSLSGAAMLLYNIFINNTYIIVGVDVSQNTFTATSESVFLPFTCHFSCVSFTFHGILLDNFTKILIMLEIL